MKKIKYNIKIPKKENKFINLITKENMRITGFILPYLEYKEVLSLSKVNKSFYSAIKNHKIIKMYITKGKLKKEEHYLFYVTNLNLSNVKSNIEKELIDYDLKGNLYQRILELAHDLTKKEKKFKKICDEIGRDLHRTYTNEKFKTGNGIMMLRNILIAIAFVRPEIGYCQGMNFIAGALINLIDNEEKCFLIFLSFIDNIHLNLLFLKNMPDFLIRVYQLKRLIELYFPKLYNHFRRIHISIDMFFSKWLLTIFANYFPFDVLYQVWDVFIIDKWKSLFKFSLILLNFMKDKLLEMELNEFFQYFNNNEIHSSLSFDDIIKHYDDYKVTKKNLKELREDFFVEQVQKKLNDPNAEWEDDQNEYVENYKKELEKHILMIQEPIEDLQKKIEKNNKDYEYKFEKYEKQFEIMSDLKIKIDNKYEAKNGYENILKRTCTSDKKTDTNKNNDKINCMNILDKKNNEGIIGSIMNFFSSDDSEEAKIKKKIKNLNKEIEDLKKMIESNQKILDKYKNELEISQNEQNRLKIQLENIENNSKKTKKNLLKNLSEKLKLTAKFVATSKY